MNNELHLAQISNVVVNKYVSNTPIKENFIMIDLFGLF